MSIFLILVQDYPIPSMNVIFTLYIYHHLPSTNQSNVAKYAIVPWILLLMSEILLTSWGNGSLSHCFIGFQHHPRWLGMGFQPSTVWGIAFKGGPIQIFIVFDVSTSVTWWPSSHYRPSGFTPLPGRDISTALIKCAGPDCWPPTTW